MKHSILCIDDEADIVDSLERLFRKNYNVHKATTGNEALKILKNNPVSLIISDQRMPEMTGVEFLKKSIQLQPEAIRILLTGYTDIQSAVAAINAGEVYRYITKPWDPVDLVNTVDKAIEKFELRIELEKKNKALKTALKELQTLDQAKSNFMILINHELKTPLTVILSFLDLLRETKLSEEQDKYTGRIKKSADRLKEIIDDVLTIVSAEMGQLKIQKTSTTTKKLFSSLLPEFQESVSTRGQTLVTEFEDNDLKVDPDKMKSVLRRILENAVKYGEKKSEIVVKSESTDDGVRISIVNEGKTLDAETIDKILKPFTLDEDVLHHSEGLGLGLSLCQALLRAHDSELAIKSKSGKTEVSFILQG